MSKPQKKVIDGLQELEKKLARAEDARREALAKRHARVPYQQNRTARLVGHVTSDGPLDKVPIDKLVFEPACGSQSAAGRAAVEYNTALNRVVELKMKIANLRG